MTNILITGLAGTGKSIVIEELRLRDYDAIDASDPFWSEWQRVRPSGSDELGPRDEWLWREDRMRHHLTSPASGIRFVGGCAANQGQFRHHFDAVILLVASLDRMLERLEPRWDLRLADDRFERYLVRRSVERVLPHLRATATSGIETTNRGVTEIADLVLEMAATVSDEISAQRA